MCIIHDREPRKTKYIVEGEVKVGRADHHDYVIPRSIICILSVIGTFLFIAGGIILLVGSYTNPWTLLPWGAVIIGIGFFLIFLCFLLCMHAHCILPKRGYKVISRPEKKNVVLVTRISTTEDQKYANKPVFAASGTGESGTLSSSRTDGRSGYFSSAHSQETKSESTAFQSHATAGSASAASGAGAYGTMGATQSAETQIVVQPATPVVQSSHVTQSESHATTGRSVTVVDGGQGVSVVTTGEAYPPAGSKQAVYVQVQPQSPPVGQQAQRIQTHAQKVEYAQIQARNTPPPVATPPPFSQQEIIMTTNVQQQHSAPQMRLESNSGQTQGGQYQYSYSTQQATTPVSPPPEMATSGFSTSANVGTSAGFSTTANTAGQQGQQAQYKYTETTTQYSSNYAGQDDSAQSSGLVIPSHFQGEATPDLRLMRRDMSNMSNVSNISSFSRPDSIGVEKDDDFEYYPGSEGHQSNQAQYSYQYQYSAEQPQTQTQSQSSTVTYHQGPPPAGQQQYKSERKGSLYEHMLSHQ